jgi:hypothetical protein
MCFSYEQPFMRVHDQNLTGASSAATGRATETQKTDRSGGASSISRSGTDHIELSGALGSISRALAADGGGRAARVQELAAAYQSGRYHPDAAATSRAMVSDALAPAIS